MLNDVHVQVHNDAHVSSCMLQHLYGWPRSSSLGGRLKIRSCTTKDLTLLDVTSVLLGQERCNRHRDPC